MKNSNDSVVAIPDSELLYIKTTIEWLRDNTELIDHNRTQQETIYNSVQNSLDAIERARAEPNTKNSVLHIFSVSRWAYFYDNAKPLMIGFIAAMLLNTTYKLIETIIIKIALIINGS